MDRIWKTLFRGGKIMAEQLCRHCKKWLPLSGKYFEENKHIYASIFNLRSICRQCVSKRDKNIKQNMKSRFNEEKKG